MNPLRKLIAVLGHGIRVVACVVAVVAILWAVAYRLVLAFTPPWLDAVTLGAAAVAMLVLLALGRSDSPKDSERQSSTKQSP
jgi:hypothetical protein